MLIVWWFGFLVMFGWVDGDFIGRICVVMNFIMVCCGGCFFEWVGFVC